MSTLLFILGIIIQILIGVGAAFYYVKVLKRQVFGHMTGAIIVGVVGSVLIGFFLTYTKVFKILVIDNPFAVDFIANSFGAFLLIWLFSKLAHQ